MYVIIFMYFKISSRFEFQVGHYHILEKKNLRKIQLIFFTEKLLSISEFCNLWWLLNNLGWTHEKEKLKMHFLSVWPKLYFNVWIMSFGQVFECRNWRRNLIVYLPCQKKNRTNCSRIFALKSSNLFYALKRPKTFKIWWKFCHLTTCPNDMIQT